MDDQEKKNKEESANQRIWREVRTLILAALAFVTALAWNSAFQGLFESNNFLHKGGPWVYAIIISGVTIGLTFALGPIDAPAIL